MDYEVKRTRIDKLPESRLLEELEKVARHFNYVEFGWRDFNKVSDISANTIKKHYGTWKKGLNALKIYLQKKGSNLYPRPYAPQRIFSEKELFDEMEKIWQKVGQRPSRIEWEMSNPKISYNTYKRRFGSWTNAYLRFIEYKVGGDILADDFVLPDKGRLKTQLENKKDYRKENSRNVSLKLRLQILSRDNFRCVYCGKSPATNIGTRLHIDHILPFSKGGKSIFENLQTLCEECNIGKSNKKI